jgi:hypothetical protein
MLVVTGENASGKSIFRRALTQHAQSQGIFVMHLSPEGKARGGIVGAVIYGTEEYQSTGVNSSATILKALATAKGEEREHIIIFDEPDTGLSDDYAAGAGLAIREFCENSTDHTLLVVVISHRRSLVRELEKAQPHHLSFGLNENLNDWLNRRVEPQRLDRLKTADKNMFGAIQSARNAFSKR